MASHRKIFFRKSREVHDAMRRGTLRLVPADGAIGEWRRDYEPMRDAMIFGEIPTFEEIIGVVRELETRINHGDES